MPGVKTGHNPRVDPETAPYYAEAMSPTHWIDFIRRDIWRIRVRDLPPGRSFLVRLLRVVILTIRGLSTDRWQLRASALTFFSVLAIVPVLAIGFGVAKGFGLDKPLEKVLYERFPGQEEVVSRAVVFAHNLLANVRGGLMATIGLVVLFYAAFKVLSHIENAMNDIWGIRRARPLGRKVTDYVAIMLIFPFFLIMSSGVTVFISGEVRVVVDRISLLGPISPLIFFLLKLLPFWVIWLLFTFLYQFMPNTRIHFRSAALGGIVAGTVFQLFQGLYIYFQVNLATYNAIYGSFAALPLFFIWLQFSWMIVLFGAEVSSAYQNVDAYEFEPDRRNMSQAFRRLISLRLTHMVIQAFTDEEKEATVEGLARELETPTPLINQLLFDLVEAGVLSEVASESAESPSYQPALDPDRITIQFVVEALDRMGGSDIPVLKSGEWAMLEQNLEHMAALIRQDPANRLLKDIRLPGPSPAGERRD